MTAFRRATAAAAVIATPATAVAWLLTGRPGISATAIGWCLLSASIELVYVWLLASAYRRGELSVVYPIARGSAPLLAVIAGLGLLNEKLTSVQLVGVGILLLGILAVTVPQTSGRATVPALLTGVAIASYTAVDRVGVRLSTPWLYGWLLVALLAIGVTVSVWITSKLSAARGQALDHISSAPPSGRVKPIVIGLLMWGGYLIVLWALSLAPLSVVAPVRETAVVGVAVWGVWKLRETKAAAMKLSGAVATLVGVSMLAF